MGLVALIALTVSALVMITMLVQDLAGISRREGFPRSLLTGLLIMNSAALINTIAQLRNWSHTQLDVVDPITGLMTLTGFAIVVRGLVVLRRERRRARRVGHLGE